MSSEPRPYSSTRRNEQAAATRRRIAAAARQLFLERGFAGATVEAIAQRAGVATPTVYAAYGSKRAILLHLLEDLADRESLLKELSAEPEPHAQLRILVAFVVRFFTEAADLNAVVRAAAPYETELDQIRIEGEARRRRAQGGLIRSWAERGALRAGLSEQEAGDIMWAMASDLVYSLFVRGNGWTLERYERWLYDTLTTLLLA